MPRAIRVSSVVLLASWALFGSGIRASPAAVAPSEIALTPGTGPPTATISVTGAGFAASSAVDIVFDSETIGAARTNSSGNLSATVSIPAAALPGPHDLIVRDRFEAEAEAAFTVQTDWPHVQFDAGNTGFNPYENVLSTANVGSLEQKWSAATAPGGAPEPIVYGGLVIVAPADGVVRALDPSTGATVWAFDTGQSMSGAAPTAVDGVVYVGTFRGRLVALDAASGDVIWSADIGGRINTSVTVAGGRLFVVVTHQALKAVDPSDGAVLWTTNTAGGTPAVGGGRVFVMGEGYFGSVSAFDAATGAIGWTRLGNCGEGCYYPATLAYADDLVVANLVPLEALSPVTGRPKWQAQTRTELDSSSGPAVAEGVVYLSAFDEFGAWDEMTGDRLWSSVPEPRAHIAPAIANGVVYLPAGRRLMAFDAATGEKLFVGPGGPSGLAGATVIADGTVYTSSPDGTITAYGLPDTDEGR